MTPFSALFVALTSPIFITLAIASEAVHPNPLSDEFIDVINRKQSSWRAGRNFPENTPLNYFRRLMGRVENNKKPLKLQVTTHDTGLILSLPESFDPRDKWPNCPTLNEIRDQGSCGSCWAFGAVEAMTDRVCTYSNGTQNFHFSAQDLLSCCDTCGLGCEGGQSQPAWDYWHKNGIVSGNSYNSSQGCRPYEIAPCEHYVIGKRKNCTKSPKTPKCKSSCEAGYNVSYAKDKRFGKAPYFVKGEEQIKAELFKNGPVEACFKVYSDFIHYKSGVYKHVQGEVLGGHCIKMMGWGVDNGDKYWLIANSWNSDWGDTGFVKILRGENHVGIESEIVTGEPVL